VTGAVAGFATQVMFDRAPTDVQQLAVTASLGRFATANLGWAITAGGVVGGSIDDREGTRGGTAGVQLSYLPAYEGERTPFVALTASLSGTLATAIADDGMRRPYRAFDLRGGVIVGKTLAERLVPYLALRLYGGPALWTKAGEAVTGGDRYHVTMGAGLVVRLPARLSITAELMPFGERSAALGVGAAL